jgi:hypothetical protein
MSRRYLTNEQTDAVLAGLRLLEQVVDSGDLDAGIYDILTNSGQNIGLDSMSIDELCEAINRQEYRGLYDLPDDMEEPAIKTMDELFTEEELAAAERYRAEIQGSSS